MIEKLTENQINKIPEYVNKWVDIGLNTDRLSPEETTRIVNDYQEHILTQDRTEVVIFDNPLECWVACNYIEDGVASIDDIDDLRTKVYAFFDLPKEERLKLVKGATWPYQDGSYFASVFSFYDYMINELDELEIEESLLAKYQVWQETSKLGPIFPLDTIAFVSQKATVIKMSEENQLHCDGAPAIEYAGRGDFKVYSLFGVRVSEEYAVTPSHEIDLDTVLSEQNADVKAALVRKVGIERLLDKGVKVDTYENYDQEENPWFWKSEYELWDMNFLFETHDYAPHLKMLNQTTGIWHVEAVSPSCRTLKDALKERFGESQYEIMSIA